MLGVRIPRADEAMLISGGRGGTDGTPFRVVIGNSAFVMPFLRSAAFLTLRMQEATVEETCQTVQGITVNLSAVGAFKVGDDTQSIVAAGQRFLSDQRQMGALVGRGRSAPRSTRGARAGYPARAPDSGYDGGPRRSACGPGSW